ncbi:TonB-dependent siderophore receptor [Acidicapsa ligni]|uniref:TonB-dependent siderophore receptor n=1 Tax=Acidicapsa ligni TaxID=542300 RepID=UPI0021DFF44C|nr:TonB-dependent receptor [Acidicapsa ligni]
MYAASVATSPRQTRFLLTIMLCIATSGSFAFAQEQTSVPDTSQSQAGKVQPVTTTVVVQEKVSDDYLPKSLSVGNFDGLPLLNTPVSATVVTRDLMTDQFSRLLSDVVKNDASIGEDYAPVGYYGDFQIRGFAIDLATGLQINGLVIAGEQDVPLENKERVEFLKGIAGVESGITTAGGLINYVTKRPALVKAFDLATDHRGTAYAALDIGQLFGHRKQYGVRANMAGEDIHTYVESANGWRGVGALASDWKISDVAMLKTDFEYQHKRERSVAGYQLLGGTIVPSLNQVFPSVMLGDQPWSKPNIFDAFNANSRLDLNVTRNWHTYMAGSYSHSLIDDNVIYPYGAALASDLMTPLCAPIYFFCSDGSYEIYDYRSPGELRIDAIGEIISSGQIRNGSVTHNLTFGGSIFHRSVDLSPTVVYTPLGVENIFQPNILYPIESPVQHAGPSTLSDFNHQSSGILQDRVTLPGRVQVTAGGRYASVNDFNYTGSRGTWLPQYSATYTPVTNMTLYGNYSVMLSLGPQAPFWALNGNAFLAPFFTRQAEVGAKYEPNDRILLTTAFFRMRTPFFYPKVVDTSDAFCTVTTDEPGECFESQGRETHDGIELGAQGKAASWLRLSATAAGTLATSDETGTPTFDDKQVINEPRIKTAFFADVSLPHTRVLRRTGFDLADLHLLPGWSYTGRKEATRDDVVSVGGYNLFNLGARYSPGGEQSHVTFRLYADNILNKRYWKDTGASLGDTFIHLGAPATVRLSAHYNF